MTGSLEWHIKYSLDFRWLGFHGYTQQGPQLPGSTGHCSIDQRCADGNHGGIAPGLDPFQGTMGWGVPRSRTCTHPWYLAGVQPWDSWG